MKMKYEKPVLFGLGSGVRGGEDCVPTGGSAFDKCQSGGSAAGGDCKPGNSAATCDSGSSP